MSTESLKFEPTFSGSTIELSGARSFDLSGSEPVGTTPVDDQVDRGSRLTIRVAKDKPRNASGNLLAKQSRVPGVVTKAGGQFVKIRCQLPKKGDVEIEVPTSLTPDQVRAFGQTVWVGIDRQSDLKRLVVEQRVLEVEGRTAVPEDVRAWLNI